MGYTTQSEQYGLGILIALVLAVLIAFSWGCSQQGESTIGNGKVDLVEAATIRVAVGLAFSARPDTVEPAYRVATGLLVVLDADADKTALAKTIQTALAEETKKLHLDAATAASFADLVALIEAQIMEKLNASPVTSSQKAVILRDVLTIVRDTAAARMAPTGQA